MTGFSVLYLATMLWFTIGLELLILTCSFTGILSSLVFLFIVLSRHEFRQNLALMLAANLSAGGLISCSSMMFQGMYMIISSSEDSLCPLRSYFFTVGGLYIFQAALLQTLHRLLVTVFVHHRQRHHRCSFLVAALVQLFLCVIGLLPLLLNRRFPYFTAANACYIALNDIVGVLYPAVCFYFLPLILQSICSYCILRHVSRTTRAARMRITAQRRCRKEQRILARLFLPVIFSLSVGLIYFVFFFGTILTNGHWQVPSYALHLSFLGSSMATAFTMFVNLIVYKQVKRSIWLSLQRLMLPCAG